MRSPLLAPMPRYRKPGRAARVTRRMLACAILAGAFVALQLSVPTKRLGAGQAAKVLYWLHDNVYLWLKGHLFTQFFPFGLAICLLILALLAPQLAGYVADRSLLRRPHLRLLRRVVAAPIGIFAAHALLRRGAAVLKRVGVQPGLLLAATEYEWTRARLRTLQGDGGQAPLVLRTTRLLMDVRLLNGGPAAAERALLDWQDALLALTSCGAREAAHLAADPRLLRLVEKVAGQPASAVLAAGDPGCDPLTCLAGLLRQTVIVGGETVLPHGVDCDRASARVDLRRAVEAQRQQLDRLRRLLERSLAFPTQAGREADDYERLFPAPALSPDVAPVYGSIMVRGSLFTAWATGDVEQALALLEAVDGLAAGAVCLSGASAPRTAAVIRRWQPWVGGLPAQQDYYLAALLADRATSVHDDVWTRVAAWAPSSLRDSDLALGDARVGALYNAAGLAWEGARRADGQAGSPPSGRLGRQTAARGPERRARAGLLASAGALSLRRRIDIVGLGLLLTVVAILASSVSLGVFLADRSGLLDPATVQPIADERLLTNVRDNLAHQAILAAAYHAPDGRLYLSQQGGTIQTYNPATGLWATDHPFRGIAGLSGDLVLLRSGCGQDAAAPTTACPDPDSLWAVSSRRGLVRRAHGHWDVVVGDTAWTGKRGRAVASADIISVAVSADKHWLLLGTRDDGVGLYDVVHHAWDTAGGFAANPRNPARADVIVWWNGAFWIGGPDGLMALHPDTRRFVPSPRDTVPVLSLTADGTNALWILEQRVCAGGGGRNCLWLGKRGADGGVETMLDERTLYQDLDLSHLTYAQQWNNELAAAGADGLYTYDLHLHAWTQRFAQPVGPHALPASDGHGFYFIYGHNGDGVGFFQDDHVRTWSIAGGGVRQIIYGGDGVTVLALTDHGDLYALTPAGPAHAVYTAQSTAFDPARFSVALDLGGDVFFLGSQGVLLQNPATGAYRDISASSLPNWLTTAGVQAYRSGDQAYFIVNGSGAASSVYVASVRDLGTPGFYAGALQNLSPTALTGPLRRVWVWSGVGIGVIDGQGSLVAVGPQGAAPQTGPPAPGLDGVALQDVASSGAVLTFASSKGLLYYDQQTRRWGTGPTTNERIRELDAYKGQMLGLSDHKELVAVADPETVLIGQRDGARVGNGTLSDARADGDDLYLAGGGWVDRYSESERRFTAHWRLGGSSAVRMRAIVNGNPLSLSNQVAYLGGQSIDQRAGPVLSLSATSDGIWTLRREAGHLYLKGYSLDLSSSRCFFLTPRTPAAATRIEDARALPDGNLAVLTNAGLYFYSPAARSWYGAQTSLGRAGGRLYLLGSYLAIVESGRIGFISVAALSFPDSCSTDPVSFTQSPQVYAASAVGVAEGVSGRAAWIAPNGAVYTSAGGGARQVLASSGGPDPTIFRQVVHTPDALFFTTTSGIWRYGLARHDWTPLRLTFDAPAAAPFAIDIEAAGSGETVTVRTANGRWFVGALGTSSVALHAFITTPARTFGASAAQFADAASVAPGVWTFVLRDHLAYYDPTRRTWIGDAAFDGRAQARRLEAVSGRLVAVGDGGRTWWVATTGGATPPSFIHYTIPPGAQATLAGGGMVVQLDRSGQVESCVQGAGSYTCTATQPAPLILDPASVVESFSWGGVDVVAMRSGLRAIDPAAHTEIPVHGTVHMGRATARPYKGQLLLADGRQVVVLQRAGTTITARTWAGADALVFDADGRPWARFADGWRYWTGSDFRMPVLHQGGARALRVFVVEGGPATAVDASGVVYEAGLQKTALRVPASALKAGAAFVLPGVNHDLWVGRGTTLQHLAAGRCLVTTPLSATTPLSTATPSTTTSHPTTTPRRTGSCLLPDGVASLGSSFLGWDALLDPQPGATRFTFWLPSGMRLTAQRGAHGAWRLTRARTSPPHPPIILADNWPSQRGLVRRLGDGRSAFDPVISLTLDASSGVDAARPSGATVVGQGATAPQVLPALDAGWLRWDRRTGRFSVASANGRRTFTPSQFIVHRQLLFEPVGAVLARTPDHVAVANTYGVWAYRQSTATLTGAVTFQPVALAGPLQAAAGRFLAANGDLPFGASAVVPPQRTETVRVDGVTLTERLGGALTAVRFLRGGVSYDGRASAGFTWDAKRRGVGFAHGQLDVQSAVGIAAVPVLGPYIAGPVQDPQTLLVTERANGLEARGPSGYYQRGTGGWTAAPDPALNRPLLRQRAWTWTVRNGQATIALQGATYNFHLSSNGGLGFSSDQIRAASSLGDALFVMSNAYLETGSADQVGAYSAVRYTPRPTDLLESLDAARGGATLFEQEGRTYQRWDTATHAFTPVAPQDDPRRQWPLIAQPRLRFTRSGAVVRKEILLDELSGPARWNTFNLQGGRFAFDRVTSVGAAGAILYVGTDEGLEVYRNAGGSLSIGAMQSLLDLGGPAPVASIGRPSAAPGLLEARGQVCVALSGGQATGRCPNPTLLDDRLRLSSSLWTWTLRAGRLSGLYSTTGGGSSLPVTISRGRFAHDDVADAGACQGQTFSIWRSGWISAYPAATFSLAATLDTEQRVSSLQRLLCLDQDEERDGVIVPSGSYVRAADGRFWVYTRSGWNPVAPGQGTVLQDYLDRRPAYERTRLRVRPDAQGGAFAFEHLTQESQWRPVPWVSGQAAFDQWSAVLAAGGTLWAQTPLGLVGVNQQGAGAATLDPNALTIVQGPLASTTCRTLDARPDGGAVLARCDGVHVYRGVLDGVHDQHVFTAVHGPDPFALRTLVGSGQSNGLWRWTLVDTTGRGGFVQAVRLGPGGSEPIGLSAGRFDFDVVASLALFQPGWVEVGSQAGWFEAPRTAFDADQWRRPPSMTSPVPSKVTHLVFGTDAHGKTGLCLTASGATMLWSVSGNPTPTLCHAYLGQDDLWRYVGLEQGGVEMVEQATSARRVMEGGRFADDQVTGLPITGRDSNGPSYAVPTKAGVLRLDSLLTRTSVTSAQPDLAGGGQPSVLYMWHGAPAYLASGRLYSVGDGRVLAPWVLRVPSGDAVVALDSSGRDGIRVVWASSQGQGWRVFDVNHGAAVEPANGLAVNLRTSRRYQDYVVQWANPPATAAIAVTSSNVRLYWPGARAHTFAFPQPLRVIAAIPFRQRVLIIGAHAMEEFNIDPALLTVQARAARHGAA